MPKLDIEFKLTGLEFKIKGESEDVTEKVADLQRQVQNLMGTITSLTQGGVAGQLAPPSSTCQQKTIDAASPAQLADSSATPSRRKGGARKGAGGGQRTRAAAIDSKLDDAKYGFPKQTWSTAQKALWLLYVVTDSGLATETTASVLSATFNKHFKTFGTITTSNAARDLAKEKGKNVNTDATKTPETWYLLEAGKKHVAAFIASEVNGTPAE